MSRHTYTTPENVTVTMGYDRPLDFIHCTVEKDGDILYTNLDDPKAGCEQQSVDYYRPVLKKLGVELPETVFKEVALDQLRRVGNRNVVHPTGLGV